jgi:hypothetical protein
MTRKQTEHDTPIYRKARAELLRDQPICHWCHRNTATELDHLVETDQGGTLDDGYVASCKPCNSARGATYQNRKLANAKQNREKAINNFLYSTTLTPSPKTVVSGAHRLDLACLLFDDLAPILEEYYGAKIVKSYGRYQATMPDGSKWWVKALKPNQGHGMSIDLVIVDELFDVNPDSVEGGLLPAQRARKNPLACFFSTAGTEESVLFSVGARQAFEPLTKASRPRCIWRNGRLTRALTRCIQAHGRGATQHSVTRWTWTQLGKNQPTLIARHSCAPASTLWVSVVRGWIEPGRWPSLEYTGDVPNGGVVAIESSLDDSRYSATRCVNLSDGRVLVTVAFIAESITELWENVQELAKDPTIRFALSPTVDATCPPNIERRRVVVGYAELGRFTPLAKNMIAEARLLHTGEKLLAEHVQRAVAVRTDNTIVLSASDRLGLSS